MLRERVDAHQGGGRLGPSEVEALEVVDVQRVRSWRVSSSSTHSAMVCLPSPRAISITALTVTRSAGDVVSWRTKSPSIFRKSKGKSSSASEQPRSASASANPRAWSMFTIAGVSVTSKVRLRGSMEESATVRRTNSRTSWRDSGSAVGIHEENRVVLDRVHK